MDIGNLFLTLSGALVIGTHAAATASERTAAPAAAAHVEVEYADTFQGTQALFAVRACMAEDRPSSNGATHLANPLAGAVRESLTDTNDDVIVRVFDASDREISRHVGPLDVCGYARISAAFVISINSAPKGDQK